jgi:hypothetical protein
MLSTKKKLFLLPDKCLLFTTLIKFPDALNSFFLSTGLDKWKNKIKKINFKLPSLSTLLTSLDYPLKTEKEMLEEPLLCKIKSYKKIDKKSYLKLIFSYFNSSRINVYYIFFHKFIRSE